MNPKAEGNNREVDQLDTGENTDDASRGPEAVKELDGLRQPR